MYVSLKIVKIYRNHHALTFSNGKIGNNAPVAALTSVISG
jgi:hypothetical protein